MDDEAKHADAITRFESLLSHWALWNAGEGTKLVLKLGRRAVLEFAAPRFVQTCKDVLEAVKYYQHAAQTGAEGARRPTPTTRCKTPS